MYHDFNDLPPHELMIYMGLKIAYLVAGEAHGIILKSCVPYNTWYAESCGRTLDFLRILSESWAWMTR